MNQTEMLTRFVQRLDIDVVLCAGRYTVLDRSAERDLLPACLANGTSLIAAGVFNSGLLADPHHQATFNYKPAPPELIRQAHQFHEVCAAHNVPLKAAAIQFPHRHPAVTATLVGCRSPEEVTEDITLFHQPIPQTLWDDLDTLHQQHNPS
jgi:D-threo-aldose 1-dehydrogenase